MEQLPYYISAVFIITTAVTIYFFYRAARRSVIFLVIAALWLLIQGILGWKGFYTITDATPPRLLFLIGPPLVCIAVMFLSKGGRKFIDQMDARWLTWLHVIRIPVEITLYWLFVQKMIPQLMTFEGRNFDIVAGITAPLIAWFGYHKRKIAPSIILIWNIVCLGLLMNIVVNAVLSTPGSLQQFAFDQPNIAILHFPFNWLPSVLVPIVFFSQLICIRQILKTRKTAQLPLSQQNYSVQGK